MVSGGEFVGEERIASDQAENGEHDERTEHQRANFVGVVCVFRLRLAEEGDDEKPGHVKGSKDGDGRGDPE